VLYKSPQEAYMYSTGAPSLPSRLSA